jgi:hypothetical protein
VTSLDGRERPATQPRAPRTDIGLVINSVVNATARIGADADRITRQHLAGKSEEATVWSRSLFQAMQPLQRLLNALDAGVAPKPYTTDQACLLATRVVAEVLSGTPGNAVAEWTAAIVDDPELLNTLISTSWYAGVVDAAAGAILLDETVAKDVEGGAT